MKGCKSLKLSKNLVSTLPSIRPLGTLALFLLVSSFPAQAASLQKIATPKTFADWCLNKNNLSVETKHTIDALLQVAETTDCNQASKLLSALTQLYLGSNQIADLKPLSTLTNLTSLYLDNNQIADIKPLSTLTNLTLLWLDNNQIADLKPLSTLTNLGQLYLGNNQIADIKPLSTLTNLGELYLGNNQTLVDKTCPVKPASICRFVPAQADKNSGYRK